jgi:hypothetical protein
MIKNLLISLLVNTIICESVFAGCSQPVFHLQPNQPAPCEGYLFSVEKEKELRLLSEDYKILKDKFDAQQYLTEIYKTQTSLWKEISDKEKERAELWRQAAEASTQKYLDAQERSSNRDLWFLLGGVVLTVAAGFAVGAASK